MSQFVVDTENLQLDAADIARLSTVLTETGLGFLCDTPNAQLDTQDLARLNASLTSMVGFSSENLQLQPHDIAILKPHLSHSYVAKAVHFDGAATLQIPAISTPASSATIISSHWEKVALANWSAVGNTGDVPAIYVVDPLGQYGPQFSHVVTPNPGNHPQIDFNALDTTGGSFLDLNSATVPVAGVGGWQHFLNAAKVDLASGSKLGKVYLNDADITNVNSDPAGAFNIRMNGFLFCVGNDAGFDTPLLGDLCDLRVVLGYNPFVAGDLPVAFRRLFIDANGKPVDPSVATAALGGPGIVLCSGDASPTGFQHNQGTGGAFTLTGALTNASTHP